MASRADILAISNSLTEVEYAPLIVAYQAFPICNMRIGFVKTDEGRVTAPGDDFLVEYDPGDHEIRWCNPRQILDDLESKPGRAVFAAGYLPIGMPTSGGDWYYLKVSSDDPGRWPLYEIYFDWVDVDGVCPVGENARDLISPSFGEVLAIAHFAPG